MVFPKNILKLAHKDGANISFNPLDALKCVANTVDAVEVSCAEAWQEARWVNKKIPLNLKYVLHKN